MKQKMIKDSLSDIYRCYKKIYEITSEINEDSEPENIWNIIKERRDILLSIPENTDNLRLSGKIQNPEKGVIQEINDIVGKIKEQDENVKSIVSGKMKSIKNELLDNNQRVKAAAAYTLSSIL